MIGDFFELCSELRLRCIVEIRSYIVSIQRKLLSIRTAYLQIVLCLLQFTIEFICELGRIVDSFLHFVRQLFWIDSVELYLTDNHRISQWISSIERVVDMVAGPQYLFIVHGDCLEENLDQIGPIIVVKVLLSEVGFVPGSHPTENKAHSRIGSLLQQ